MIIDVTPPPGTPMPLLVMVPETGFFALDMRPERIRVEKLAAAVLPDAVNEAYAKDYPVEHWVDTRVKLVSPLHGWMVERARQRAA